jgi:hypothetical protein
MSKKKLMTLVLFTVATAGISMTALQAFATTSPPPGYTECGITMYCAGGSTVSCEIEGFDSSCTASGSCVTCTTTTIFGTCYTIVKCCKTATSEPSHG